MSMMEFTLPDPGEGLVEAEIVTWHIKAGDDVEVNQVVLEIETAKSLVELPIPWAGRVAEVLVPEGETVEVGTPIVTIDVSGAVAPQDDGSGAASPVASQPDDQTRGAEPAQQEMQTAADVDAAPAGVDSMGAASTDADSTDAGSTDAASTGEADDEPQQKTLVGYGPSASSSRPRARRGRHRAEVLAAPATRGFAKEHGVDLETVRPSREDGVISRDDVAQAAGGAPSSSGSVGSSSSSSSVSAVSTPQAPSALDAAKAAQSTPPERPVAPSAGVSAVAGPSSHGLSDERVPIKGVRKVTAQAMVNSAFSAPHVTEFLTVDVTRTMEFVAELQRDRAFKDIKVTPLLVVAKACLLAMKREPMMNALWDDAAGEIVMRSQVNLGIAAATDRGLLVPNVKDAGRFALGDLGREIGKLIDVARHGKPSPAILNGGTFTISNIGVFGVDAGTPIIKPGESGILAIGAVRPMPWVVENAVGEQELAIRQVAQLSLSFDHRIIDGDVGSRFIAAVGQMLENPARAMAWS